MPVTEMITDTERFTLTVVADFVVPVARLWDAYIDPRQIEQFWGPPEYPATFARHDAYPGGRSHFTMTGPGGDQSHGYWEWLSVDPGRSFEVRDGFASDDATPNPDLPSMRIRFEFSETALGSRLTTTTSFGSLENLEQLTAMGMQEGLRAAMGQIDTVVEDLAAFAAGRVTEALPLGETQLRVARVIRGGVEDVWRAHTDPELLKRWQLGPEGWSMPVCEVGTTVGDALRSEWQNDETGDRFGFVGEVVDAQEPYRFVTTERMVSPENPEGAGSPEALNELTLTPVSGGTLTVYVITYPSAEVRAQVQATGMVDGMEAGYARLEREVLAA